MIRTGEILPIWEVLSRGGICAIPTETVYGLAGNALDPKVVARIFEIKNRPSFDPLIVHVSGREQLSGLVREITELEARLMDAFWPGPLTILLPRTDAIPDLVCSGSVFAGFRVPDHPLTLELLRGLEFPLAAPSANPFGYISPTTPEHVLAQLGEKIDGILDGGPCQVGIESTVVKVTETEIQILRAGGITPEALEQAVGLPVRLLPASAHPTAPGMLLSHYAPAKSLVLTDNTEMELDSPDTAWLRFDSYIDGVPVERQFLLAPDGNLTTAARQLFALLRELDADARIGKIVAVPVPEKGLGIAINDKLRKAAHR